MTKVHGHTVFQLPQCIWTIWQNAPLMKACFNWNITDDLNVNFTNCFDRHNTRFTAENPSPGYSSDNYSFNYKSIISQLPTTDFTLQIRLPLVPTQIFSTKKYHKNVEIIAGGKKEERYLSATGNRWKGNQQTIAMSVCGRDSELCDGFCLILEFSSHVDCDVVVNLC